MKKKNVINRRIERSVINKKVQKNSIINVFKMRLFDSRLNVIVVKLRNWRRRKEWLKMLAFIKWNNKAIPFDSISVRYWMPSSTITLPIFNLCPMMMIITVLWNQFNTILFDEWQTEWHIFFIHRTKPMNAITGTKTVILWNQQVYFCVKFALPSRRQAFALFHS